MTSRIGVGSSLMDLSGGAAGGAVGGAASGGAWLDSTMAAVSVALKVGPFCPFGPLPYHATLSW